MDAVVWLTYDELAARLGIERESARQQVKRKRWARQNGNDGKVRIAVPEEVLSAGSEPGTEGGAEPGRAPGQVPAPDPGVTAVLIRHIERLEGQLEEALKRAADRDQIAAQRDLTAAQVEALNAVLAIERKRVEDLKDAERQRIEEIRQRADEARQRTEELKAERDRWAAAAGAAQERIEQLIAKAAETETRRSWWPWRRSA